MLHPPDQGTTALVSPPAPSALSPTTTAASSPPSSSAPTFDTSSLFIPRRRTPTNARGQSRHPAGNSSHNSLRRTSAPGGSGKLPRPAEEGDAMAHLQSEMGGVSLHRTQELPGSCSSSLLSSSFPRDAQGHHELAVDIKRRLFNDAPPRPAKASLVAHPPWQDAQPEQRYDSTRSPRRRLSQAHAHAQARDSPQAAPRMGILTRSKVSRAGSVKISEPPSLGPRRGASQLYHDGNGTGNSNGSEAGLGTGGASVHMHTHSSPRASPLYARGRSRAATPYPGESSQGQGQEDLHPVASSSPTSLHHPVPPLAEVAPSLLATSPRSPHSLPSSYPGTTSTSTSTSTSTILLSHAESSSLQRAHFLSEKAREEERALLRGLEMCTGLGQRLGGWERGGGTAAAAAGGSGRGDGLGGSASTSGGLRKSAAAAAAAAAVGGRDRWVVRPSPAQDQLPQDDDPQLHLQHGHRHGHGDEDEDEDEEVHEAQQGEEEMYYAHEDQDQDQDQDEHRHVHVHVHGHGHDHHHHGRRRREDDGDEEEDEEEDGEEDALFDFDYDDGEPQHEHEGDEEEEEGGGGMEAHALAHALAPRGGGGGGRSSTKGRGRGRGRGMDALHESFEEEEEVEEEAGGTRGGQGQETHLWSR